MRKCLITGANGFVGSYLVSTLQEHFPCDLELFLSGRRENKVNENAKFFYSLDITDVEQVKVLIAQLKPDIVVHLAAQAHVPTAWQYPEKTMDVNINGTLHLLEALSSVNSQCLFVYISSADIYGLSFKSEFPITEASLLQPCNPYAVSKASADMLVRQYGLSGKLNTVCLRPFNHVGVGQSENYVIASIAKQLAQIKSHQIDPYLKLGNIDVSRNFLDVKDVVDAYCLVIKRFFEKPEVINGQTFNVCASSSKKIRDIVQELCDIAEINPEIICDASHMRPNDIATVNASNQRLKTYTKWQPRVPWRITLKTIFDSWYSKV